MFDEPTFTFNPSFSPSACNATFQVSDDLYLDILVTPGGKPPYEAALQDGRGTLEAFHFFATWEEVMVEVAWLRVQPVEVIRKRYTNS